MTISMLAHSALGENATAIRHNIGRLNMNALYRPTAKIMILSGQAVLSDLHSVGAPLYSTPVDSEGKFLARIHRFAAKRNIGVLDSIYVRAMFEVSR